jgi:hypothetical protein
MNSVKIKVTRSKIKAVLSLRVINSPGGSGGVREKISLNLCFPFFRLHLFIISSNVTDVPPPNVRILLWASLFPF